MLFPLIAVSLVVGHPGAASFSMEGRYVEGCACHAPCTCEMSGLVMGCEGVGTFDYTAGEVDGVHLNNCKGAYATVPGKWVLLYIDAPSKDQRAAVEKMMRYTLTGFGPVQGVRQAKITMTGTGGNYKTSVGNYFTMTSRPMMGGDGKNPLRYENTHDRVHPDVMGGTTINCVFKDGSRSFKLKDSNAFFNEHLKVSGKM
jgi:hypothetical protein